MAAARLALCDGHACDCGGRDQSPVRLLRPAAAWALSGESSTLAHLLRQRFELPAASQITARSQLLATRASNASATGPAEFGF
jgi:hypothetical protein